MTTKTPSPMVGNANQSESCQPDNRKIVSRIATLSFVLWLISLALPGFTIDGSNEVYGVLILIEGVLLGWGGGVYAAYANIFYLYASIVRTKNEIPFKSIVLMICLAATTLFIRRIFEMGLITSWGWGAILWGISLLLLVVAVLTQKWRLSSRRVAWMIGAIGVILLSIFGLNRYQWFSANIQDRTAYLPPSMAFSATKLCDVPVTLVEKSLVPAEESVSIDSSMDEFLKNSSQNSYPILSHFEKNGYEWVYRGRSPNFEIGRKVADDAKSPRFLLRAAPHESGYQIQLVDKSSEQIVYEQRIVDGSFRNVNHCPSPYGDLGYLQNIRKAVGQDQSDAYFAGPRLTEEGRTLCSAQYQMLHNRYAEGVIEPVKYCSEHYIALLYPSHTLENRVYLNAMIVDKKSLALVDTYQNVFKCPSEECQIALTSEIVGFRFEDEQLYVHTTGGELVVNREFRRQ